ncbi:hypothetical protein L873DRAFT_1631255, partial [Choiromyces venosus 120613-1]
LEFAQAYQHWTLEDWCQVIWTDECYIWLSGTCGRTWVTRHPGEEYEDEKFHSDCIDQTFEQGRESMMAWSGFCSTTKSELVFIPRKAKMDSAIYVEAVMEPYLAPLWHQYCKEYGWAQVIEDGALEHQKYVRLYRQKNELDAIQWPAQLPDLNLIEAIWMDLETELGETWGQIGDITTLQLCLKTIWGQIGADRLVGLIHSMPDQLHAVIAAGGESTPY